MCGQPTPENLGNLDAAKLEYEREYDYIVIGSTVRSRAIWFEKGERNNSYFSSLENSIKGWRQRARLSWLLLGELCMKTYQFKTPLTRQPN